jgi:hypothetical protein
VVVIVDQLDRIPAGNGHHQAVFWEGRGKLRSLNCHMVLATPIEYAYSRARPGLEQEYGEVLGLPLLPVTAEDAAVRRAAFGSAREVVGLRLQQCGTTPEEVFDSEDVVDDLIRLSGGHFRSLFLLLRTVIERSDLSAPLRRDHVERVIDGMAAAYIEALEAPEREVVRLVHETRAKPTDQRQLNLFYELLRDQYVFAFVVGKERWYDWYPLLERSPLGAA